MAIHSNQLLGTIEIKTMKRDIKNSKQAKIDKNSSKIAPVQSIKKEIIPNLLNTQLKQNDRVSQNLSQFSKTNNKPIENINNGSKKPTESIKVPITVSPKQNLELNTSFMQENKHTEQSLKNHLDELKKTANAINRPEQEPSKIIQNKEIHKSDIQKPNQVVSGDRYRENPDFVVTKPETKEKPKPIVDIEDNKKRKFMEDVEIWLTSSRKYK